jgi:plastocyanin
MTPITFVSRLTLLSLIALAACQTATAPGPRVGQGGPPPAGITITVTDTAYEVPSGLEAEPVTITLQNESDTVHPAFFVRLNEGVTPGQVRNAFPKGEEAILSLVTVAGALPPAKPGGTSQATIEFPEGSYVVLDPEAKGPPPMAFFEVAAATGPEVRVPAAAFRIEVGEFFFKIDGAVAGEAPVEIVNRGKQGHEVVIYRKGAEEEGFFSLAPAPGGRMWTSIDLEPGTYQVRCFFPDPKTGKPHVKLGMKATVEVA